MENLNLPASVTTPNIKFNEETGICEVSGESYMENSVKFYEPVFKWFNDYVEQNGSSIKLIMKLEYMNTSSMKHIYNLILLMKQIKDKGLNVEVEWHYDEDEIDLEEDINDIVEESGMEIKMITI